MEKYIPSTSFIASPFKTLPANGTFTRSTSAYRTNEYGILELINSNEVRHDYDPETGEYLGILLEDKLTNQIGDFYTGSWAAAGASKNISITDVVSPNGTLGTNICKLTESTNKGPHYIALSLTQTYNLIPGEFFTFSFFAKAAERSEIQVNIQNYYAVTQTTRNNIIRLQLNIETGAFLLGPDIIGNSNTVTYNEGETNQYLITYSIFSNLNVNFIKYPNGWRRITISAQFLNNDNEYNHYYLCRIRPLIYLLSTDDDLNPGLRTATYIGKSNYGAYLWGAQLEYNNSATSYIPSTRAADILKFDLNSVFSETEGTIITEFDLNSFPYRRSSTLQNSLMYPGDTIYQTIFNIHDTSDISKNIGSYISDDSIDQKIHNTIISSDDVIDTVNLKFIHAFAYETNNNVSITNNNRLIESNNSIDLSTIVNPELTFNYLSTESYWGTSTNLVPSPQTFNNTSWVFGFTTLNTNYNVYVKNIVLSKLLETIDNSKHDLTSSTIMISTNTEYVLKVVLKEAGRTSAGIYIETLNAGKYINLTNGTITGNVINAPSGTCTVTAFGSGAWLVTMPFNSGSAGHIKIHILCDDGTAPSASSGATYVGDITKGIYVGNISLALASSINYNTVNTNYSLNGHLKKLYYYSSRLTNSKLKELTNA